MKNMLSWFEIPVIKLDRAMKFYSQIFGYEFKKIKTGETEMAWFPTEEYVMSGALVAGEWYSPSSDGVLIYFHVDEDLNTILEKVEEAGGSIVISKTLVSEEIGYMATFMDSEGNRISLHSKK